MSVAAVSPPRAADLEAALFNVLLSADSLREGATGILNAIAPRLDAAAMAIAVRDRDGRTLHVLAESGELREWPLVLAPRFAAGSELGIDADTGVLVVPLRAEGRVLGALLIADGARAAARFCELIDDDELTSLAAAMYACVERSDLQLRLRARARRSIESVLEAMAHQITNPLTGASATAQLLAADLVDDTRESVRQIEHELGRAFTVLRDILEFQRDTRAQDGVLDVNAVVERLLRLRAYLIREQGTLIELRPADTYLPVRADATGFEFAFLEALRFAELRSHGSVNRTISIDIRDGSRHEVSIDIRDSGLGDAPDLTSRYFDLSWRRASGGVPDVAGDEPDLGLVDSILRGCGGRLDTRSSKTDGTTLTLVLPRAASVDVSDSSGVTS
jgi:signal transduction histidine kinase